MSWTRSPPFESCIAAQRGREASILAWSGHLLEQNDEWAVQRAREMTLESIAL
jgi:hypothetical protein